MKLLSLCGSLRAHSSNHAILAALRKLMPSDEWNFFDISELPYFDPDLQFGADVASSVGRLRALAANTEMLVIATPEYAHGIPGILKNALEWLVCEETMQKPVALLIGASSGGEFVKEYLSETLRTMDMFPSSERTMVVRGARQQISPEGEILDANLKEEFLQFSRKLYQN